MVVQTFLPDDPTIQAALRQDYGGFAREELKSRKEIGLPPFARMARVILRHQEQAALHKIGQEITEELTGAVTQFGGAVRLRGPMPCPITRIAGYFRNQIVLSSARAEPLQQVLAAVRAKGLLAKAESVAVDVDPVSLL